MGPSSDISLPRTAVISAVPLSAVVGGTAPVIFHADRPFVFEIVDTKTGAPLFLGSVADPRVK